MFTAPGPLDFGAIARETLEFWDRHQVFAALVAKNRGGPRYSFLARVYRGAAGRPRPR
jgi:hypothetical protein